eukprot:gnl/TRDRNA2_/TRDRNA2_146869_c1_seq1.p1 gnl/TRDRNA2_/TRDRNA2_146869_c1~~gnl/TRDRNA2_/TRDRNA2_146869_c1_seq1.p1  ORF type:complete len:367 (-),score=55.53 gnl/TRDRNA2_/TRDRNA2_146869_c1_seq1:397-1398(-)
MCASQLTAAAAAAAASKTARPAAARSANAGVMKASDVELVGVPELLPEGYRVKIVALQKATELNGHLGQILKFDASKGRYVVMLSSGKGEKLLKPENLACVDAGASTSTATDCSQMQSDPVHEVKTGLPPLCCYALQGRCRFGSRCRYSHDLGRGGSVVCQFGAGCLVRHNQISSSSESTSESAPGTPQRKVPIDQAFRKQTPRKEPHSAERKTAKVDVEFPNPLSGGAVPYLVLAPPLFMRGATYVTDERGQRLLVAFYLDESVPQWLSKKLQPGAFVFLRAYRHRFLDGQWGFRIEDMRDVVRIEPGGPKAEAAAASTAAKLGLQRLLNNA